MVKNPGRCANMGKRIESEKKGGGDGIKDH